MQKSVQNHRIVTKADGTESIPPAFIFIAKMGKRALSLFSSSV